MGRGNCCVTGKYEGLFYILNYDKIDEILTEVLRDDGIVADEE